MCIVACDRLKIPYHITYNCSLLKVAPLSCRVYNEYFEYLLFLSKLSSLTNNDYNGEMWCTSCYGLELAYSSDSINIRLNKLTPHIEKCKVNLFVVGQRYIHWFTCNKTF